MTGQAKAGVTFAELTRLDRRAERQDRPIEALRRKCGVNRPYARNAIG